MQKTSTVTAPHLTIALYQADGIRGDIAANLDCMARAVRQAAGLGCGLIIFPEMFLTGYNIGAALPQLAQPAGGPAGREAARMAREHNIAILYGYPEAAGSRIFNAALYVGPDGKVSANYRKTHLFGPEKQQFTPGDELVVAPLGSITLGILICYDVEFPGAVAALARAGAQLVAVPTALMHPYAHIAATVVPARAYESQVYIAYANRCGKEGRLTYCGASCITGPDGIDLARADPINPQLITAPVIPDTIEQIRADNPLGTDQRPALYGRPVGGAQ